MKFTFTPESRPLEGFTIKRAIYRGGFGEVYYGLSDAGREVAMKMLHNNAEIELRGVQQCLNLSHPNLVTIFDIRQDDDGDHWIIMEYVAGDTLDNVLRKYPGGMPMEQVRNWMAGTCAGIGYLHSRGLVHRDLKPANLFIEDKTVKIGDVGLSKFITASRRSAQTQSVGTVYYMAPEVAKGKYGKEVDIYAMGVILYEMLTGQVPFDGESTGEILMKHLTEAPDLQKLPPRMRGVVAKALSKEPEHRYESIDKLMKAFNDALLGRSEPIEIPGTSFVPDTAPQVAATLPGLRDAGASQPHDDGVDSLNKLRVATDAGWWVLIAFIVCTGIMMARMGGGGLPVGILVTTTLVAAMTYGLSRLFKAVNGATAQQRYRLRQARMKRTQYPPPPNIPSSNVSFWEKAISAVPITAGLTTLLAVVRPTAFVNAEGLNPDPAVIGLFSAVAMTGVWGLLMLPAIWGRHDKRQKPNRMAFAALGALVGLFAYGVDQYLLIDLSTNAPFHADAIYHRIGDQPLMLNGTGPTALGYALFFGSLFFVRDWSLLLRANREKRFSVSSVIWTLCVAWFVTKIFAFPLPMALAWAAILACTVQLSSPWAERRRRTRRLN